MYKIGDKVETPLGVGKLSYIDSEFAWVSINKTPEIEFDIRHIKPYQSAHDKLIALGYEYSYKECGDELSDKCHTFYNKKRFITIDVIVNNISGIGWYITFHDPFNCIANLELSRILTQYLEDMEE